MLNGGYEEGYRKVECFWGTAPAEYVTAALQLLGPGRERPALDLGCGEGKNSAAIASAGFIVTAIDKSETAVARAKRTYNDLPISWSVGDLLEFKGIVGTHELVIATGSFHCLATRDQVSVAIENMKSLTKSGGLNVLYAFDDGPQDMSGHGPEFKPILLPHSFYVSFFSDWDIIRSATSVQPDVHPHNGIEHSHSITRVLARKR